MVNRELIDETPARKSLLSRATVTALLMDAGVVSAQTTTATTTERPTDQGKTFAEYSTSKKRGSFIDPKLKPDVGMGRPGTVTL
jgi:hypothetical protein